MSFTSTRLTASLMAGLGAGLLLSVGCSTAAGAPAPAAAPPPAANSAPAAVNPAPAPPAASAPAAVDPAPAAAPASAPAAQSGYMLRLDGSEARYRAREMFVNIPAPNEAIGRTTAVTGSVMLDPSNAVNRDQSRIVVDVSTLQSDAASRDRYLRDETLRTGQFPNVTFVATEVRGLPAPLPTSGQVPFQLAGDLTIRDVTRPVVWDVTSTVDGANVSGTAQYNFVFSEWGVPVPSVARVASIFEPVVLEIDFRGTNSAS